MPDREFSYVNYRYGFNGKENDNEAKGERKQQNYGMRIYDPRLGKFLSVDPLIQSYPMLTPYAFAENDVIRSIDLDGLEKYIVTRLVNNNGAFRSITIQSFTDAEGNVRDNEAYNYNSALGKADVYVVTRNVNTGNQIGPIVYKTSLSPDEQIVQSNLKRTRDVKDMIAEDKKANPSVNGEQITDNFTEGQMAGKSWKDGKYEEANLNMVQPIPIRFPGGSSTPSNMTTAMNQLAPIGQIMNLFPTSTAIITGNTGNSAGDGGLIGNSPAVLAQRVSLNGASSTVGATMIARSNSVRRILTNNFGIGLARTAPATGTNAATPAGRNVTIRIAGINL